MKWLAACLCLLLARTALGEIVTLRDGDIVVGDITGHDEDGLSVKRLDNGGVVRLRWNQLSPPAEQFFRTKLGYTQAAGDEYLIDADEVTLADGTKKVGLIVESTKDRVLLREKENTWTYPRAMLAGPPARVNVPALSIYTRDQLYQELLGAIDVTRAADHFELAKKLERVNDFARATEHFKKIQEIDPAFHAQHQQEITTSFTRLAEKIRRQAEEDFLSDINIERKRLHWDKAIALCDEFPTKFPKSAAKEEVLKRKANIESARRRDLVRKTLEAWYPAVERIARNKATDRKLGLAAAQTWATGDLKKEVRADVLKTVQRTSKSVTETDVETFWSERLKLKPADLPLARTATYGQLGTFALGKGKALEGLNNKPGGDAGKGPAKSKEEEEMEKKIQRFLQRQQGMNGNGTGGPKKPETGEEWWDRAQSFERALWLTAFYAEFGGDMQVVQKRARMCETCGGKGVIVITATGGSTPGGVTSGGGRNAAPQNQPGAGFANVECPACHGVQVERVIAYR